jgi:hypothetical protein
MYSNQEAAQLRKDFWTAFGQYMSPIRSSESEKINWINYKTGIKGLKFKMDAGKNTASIAIELGHAENEKQQYFFERLLALKNTLHHFLHEDWTWLLHTSDEHGKTVSRIYKEKAGVSIFRKEDWSALISFFKPRIIALDEFWNSVKYGFEEWQ